MSQNSIEFQNCWTSLNWNLGSSLLKNSDLNKSSKNMKYFEGIQSKFMILGITPHQKYPLNVQSLSILLVFGLAIISTSVYVCNGVKSFDEYVTCSYECSVISVGFLGIANCIWNTTNLYRLLNSLENIINESEWDVSIHWQSKSLFYSMIWILTGLVFPISKSIFYKTDENLQKWFGILDFVALKVMSLCLTLPMLIVSFYNYFTTDLTYDAFQLPFYGS